MWEASLEYRLRSSLQREREHTLFSLQGVAVFAEDNRRVCMIIEKFHDVLLVNWIAYTDTCCDML